MIEHAWEDLSYLQFHHLAQFSNLTHGIFTRQGGHSEEPYRSLNTSTSIKGGGDSVDNVVRNRQLTLRALDMPDSPCVTLWQVHGAAIATFDPQDEWRTDWSQHSYYYQSWTQPSIRQADALITRQSNVAIALSFADCVPLTFYDPVQRVIGIAHGGWRGTARGIAAATVESMSEQFGCRPQNILAGIGPSIGECCYEITTTVREIFLGEQAFDTMPTEEKWRGLVRESATFCLLPSPDATAIYLNLWETNRKQLLLAGLTAEHIELAGICTGCNTARFFSHRKENSKTGRFPVIMALKD
ncbi:MAG TPA: peptidoglycan editing factor PgeF [Ktedonobacteraceae bacterium]|nr:peptidoglycan editing factor PgeF [Ktedonobacteraceae bacterium]